MIESTFFNQLLLNAIKQYREKKIDYLINVGTGVMLMDWMGITGKGRYYRKIWKDSD